MKTISDSGRLERLQMVFKSNTGQCVSEDTKPRKGVDIEWCVSEAAEPRRKVDCEIC